MTTEDRLDRIEMLARESQAGDSEAFKELADTLNPVLIQFFRRRGVADAEDLAQATWVRIIQHLQRYDASRSFRTWVFTIAYRLWFDQARRKKSCYAPMNELPAPEDPNKNKDISEELITQLGACLDELTANERKIIYLRYWVGLDLKDVATQMGQDYGSVKGKAYRGGQKLRKCLESKGIRKV